MTNREFSDGFDMLLNSFNNQIPFGEQSAPNDIVLNEFEKSLLLTQAQDEVILSLYSGRNPLGLSVEETEEMRRYTHSIVEDVVVDLSKYDFDDYTDSPHIEKGSYIIDTKYGNNPLKDLWFIIYESVIVKDHACGDEHEIEVLPVTHDDYHRIKKNPFRGCNERRALRLNVKDALEIVCDYPVLGYHVRFIKKPAPIILEDLPDGLSIKGISTESSCELDDAVHQMILEAAVSKAIGTRRPVVHNQNNQSSEQ